MKKHWMFLVIGLALVYSASAGAAPPRAGSAQLQLKDGWAIQSSAHISEKGDVLSTTKFSPKDWYPTSVPSTVLSALVNDKVYPDPYFGMNLRSIPGTEYPIGGNFSNIEMPADSPFRPSWWYRTEFQVPADYRGKQVWLHFGGINYRANIWLNGKLLAGSDQVVGTWRVFEFNVTGKVEPGATNALAVEVFAPHPDDLALTFVDWNPMPPDKDMGLWRGVYLSTSGPVELRFPQVITQFDLPSLDVAHLTVTGEVRNATDQKVEGVLRGSIEKTRFEQTVELAPHESKVVTFDPSKFSQLNLAHPRVWWPTELGAQELYNLHMEFEIRHRVSDQAEIQFGVRQITSKLDENNHRLFQINGKNILIRGAGWSFDMMLRVDPQKQEDQIRYVKDMNLNTIRFEGKLETGHFLSLCDRYGILVLAGWCCCDHWERWRQWKAEDYTVAEDSLRDQIRRLRWHACMLDWLNGSDNPPPAKVESLYIKVLKEENWPNPYQSSATERATSVTGMSGVKMRGPYQYVAPNYWLEDKNHGGAFGFSTEISPGPAVPVMESLREMLPADHLWPIDQYWDDHGGGGEFKTLKVFTQALDARYGKAESLEDYVEKAQMMAYEGERAMFEGYGRNKYTSTGVIQWMLNNAWPSMIWHLYDYYLRQGGGYFGTKIACEPLHVQYSYDDRSVVVVNSYYQGYKGYQVAAHVYNLDMSDQFSKTAGVDIDPDSSHAVFTIPDLPNLSTTYFLKLTLDDESGKQVSSNFYWLSTKPDVSNWSASTWFYTPISSFADFTAIKNLPEVKLDVSSRVLEEGGQMKDEVTIANPTSNLAFFVHLRLTKGQDGDDVLPVFWQDNYVSLLPGEKREITAAFGSEALGGAQPTVEVTGWNVAKTISIPASETAARL